MTRFLSLAGCLLLLLLPGCGGQLRAGEGCPQLMVLLGGGHSSVPGGRRVADAHTGRPTVPGPWWWCRQGGRLGVAEGPAPSCPSTGTPALEQKREMGLWRSLAWGFSRPGLGRWPLLSILSPGRLLPLLMLPEFASQKKKKPSQNPKLKQKNQTENKPLPSFLPKLQKLSHGKKIFFFFYFQAILPCSFLISDLPAFVLSLRHKL